MGARFLGMEEAAGSTPASSTNCFTKKGGTADKIRPLAGRIFIFTRGGKEMPNYNPEIIEKKWQKIWQGDNFIQTEVDQGKDKYYVLEMFPYPSGKLHMGHMRVYSIGDVLARFLRMNGYNVIHPMGWDAFGLPAENAAIEHGVNPALWTEQNIELMKKQFNLLGASYDWRREVNASSPDYYRWSQWLFLHLYNNGLAYKKKANVNWCVDCHTVLANEQVEKGLCWRCSSVVQSRELDQWFLKITDYADRLLNDLSMLENWPERVKVMQKNWIGRSEGAEISFAIKDFPAEELKTFTTRPDTLFGVTYMALAPEHPLVPKLVEGTDREKDVLEFISRVKQESEIERTSDEVPKKGVLTGRFAINPVNGEEIPIMVGDYVLMAYGTGAVMGVPAHDQRDFLFARQYNLPITIVVQPEGQSLVENTMDEAYTGEGTMVNSGQFNGLQSSQGIEKITSYLESKGLGRAGISYRLRDWLISRQRYWGAPIPIVYCEQCGIVPVPEKDLPVKLPLDVELSGKRVPGLSHYSSFIETSCPQCAGKARRETDTMDTFICSSWYYLRYTSPGFQDGPFSQEAANYWMPVDQYIGGIEHAVLHLLYARFMTKVLYDAKLVQFKEPFTRLLAQGMVYKDGAKMSKSKGNVITPDEIIKKYGADTSRLFILFAAPPEKDLDWSDQGVEGCYRFLRRVWRLIEECSAQYSGSAGNIPGDNFSERELALRRSTHAAIKKVTHDIRERFNFNTAISAIMELVNAVYAYRQSSEDCKQKRFVLDEALVNIVLLIAPFAPHVAEEAWQLLGGKESVHRQSWPQYNPDLLVEDLVEVVVQINGKIRGRLIVSTECREEDLIKAVYKDQRIAELLTAVQVVKVVTVPGKLVNIVTKSN